MSDDEEGQNSRIKRILKKVTKTKKTRLFVATFKERYKLYEVQLLESNVASQGPPVSKHEDRSKTSGNFQEGRCIYILDCGTSLCQNKAQIRLDSFVLPTEKESGTICVSIKKFYFYRTSNALIVTKLLKHLVHTNTVRSGFA